MSIPAKRLGLINRGMLQESFNAGICVFGAANITSIISTKNLRNYASHILHIVVNSQISMQNEPHTKTNEGQVLCDFKDT